MRHLSPRAAACNKRTVRRTWRRWSILLASAGLMGLMAGPVNAGPADASHSAFAFSASPSASALSASPFASALSASPPATQQERRQVLGHDQRIILIDAGHGGIDGGTSHGDILEKDITLAISRRLFLLLRSDGFDAILNRTGDYAPSDENRWLRSSSRHMRDLAQRKELAETLPANVVVSVHINWAPSPAKHGPLVLYRQEGRSFLLARSIQDQLNKLYGMRTDPRPGKPFYLLNKITATTVIVEAGFISSPADRGRLCSPRGQEELAEAIAGGIAAYLMEV